MTEKKLVKLNSLKTNLTAEREGDWIKAPELGEGVRFRVRSTNYPAYTVARDQASQRLAMKFPNSQLDVLHDDYAPVPASVIAEANGEIVAEHLLLGWEGFDIPYTPGDALEVLCDEAHRAVRMSVTLAATKVGRQEVEFVEGAAKNSEAPSDTK
jgi:hypothetical protein